MIYNATKFLLDAVSQYFDLEKIIISTERYPFDDFNNAFYDLPPLEGYLLEYVKQNISEF